MPSRRRDRRRPVRVRPSRRRAVRVQLAVVQRRDVQPRVEPPEHATRRGHEPSRAVPHHELRVDRRAAEQPGRQLGDDGVARPACAAAISGREVQRRLARRRRRRSNRIGGTTRSCSLAAPRVASMRHRPTHRSITRRFAATSSRSSRHGAPSPRVTAARDDHSRSTHQAAPATKSAGSTKGAAHPARARRQLPGGEWIHFHRGAIPPREAARCRRRWLLSSGQGALQGGRRVRDHG